MLKIGLTGGMGSGKSTVARIFECLEVPVYYADVRAKQLMQDDPAIREQLVHLLGSGVIKSGTLDRSYIAHLVFKDPVLLEKLNAIVHPATISDAINWFHAQEAPYVMKEAALLFESGSAAGLDYVIGVSAPLSIRLQRIMKRDGLSREAVKDRTEKQLDESIKMKLCDFVLINDEQQPLLPQVLELHQQLLKLTPTRP
jgi:dephospho-CoA kinase